MDRLFSHIVSADCKVKGGILLVTLHILKKALKELIMF